MAALSVAAARAGALFASTHDPSEVMSAAEVRAAVAAAVRRLGLLGCACCVAQEFGDHPDTAAARMVWARKTVARTWPKRGAA